MLTWRHATTACLAALFAALVGLMLAYPNEAWKAALQGLSIWWDILFPALLPFFVISELMLGFGLVHFLGTLLDPLMRPLFRVPGIGGFVMAMGLASGYPVGARLTAQLWEQRLVTREEGERLVAFTTSSDPIFLIGAVSVGFFHDVSLAVVLAAAHYGSCFLIGLLMRFHGRKSVPTPMHITEGRQGIGLMKRALIAMHHARIQDGRPLGEMLQEAIQASLRLVMVVGGLVVFFCVFLEMLNVTHLLRGLAQTTGSALRLVGIPLELSQAIVNGLFEVTLGARSAADAGDHLALVHKVAVGAFILSWAGISVHSQIVSLLNRTNLRYWPFIAARLAHAVLATAGVYLLWTPLASVRSAVSAAFPQLGPSLETGAGVGGGAAEAAQYGTGLLPWLYTASIGLLLMVTSLLLLMGALYALGRPLLRLLFQHRPLSR
ncbi:sporulation integral membrane protein YlbJ [Paenibacillus koleovorans]|uniref:sporulation integral membrane protein YlbJ n=1 Tax=Paenibacillus koleovorans TaxID=121608 RepID=UPI000FD74E92|nr:sporulation integral membrane protein YlbJ [Paenibacillus koleovorans]